MNRECPVCNSDVPADGRCCNVKCEAYSHRVFDEIKKTCEPYESEWKTEYLTELPEQDSIVAPSEMFEQASKEFHVNIKMDGETIPVNINDIGFEVCPEFKQKKQEIDKLHSEIVEAQKEFGKHTIYKKEFTIPAEENEVGVWKTIDWKMDSDDEPEVIEIDRRYIDPCNTLVDRINHDITKQALRDAKIDTESESATLTVENLCGWEPVEIPTDFKWTDGEMYYQIPTNVPTTYHYYDMDSVTIEAPEYSWYLHFESGDKVRLSDNEAYKMMENGVPDKVNLTYDRVDGEDE